MKSFLKIITIFIFLTPFNSFSQCPENFHDFTALDINGNSLDMSSFAGKKVLVVNTASFCGYTPQYEQLQTLYTTYGGSDFEIVGFPANNFGSQEPYGEDSIIQVCNSYNVTFTMMSKISVKGSSMDPIYHWLTEADRNCEQNAPVGWNFQKFMINEDGSWHGVVSSGVSPLTSTIVNWITAPTSIEDLYSKSINNAKVYQSGSNIKIEMDMEVEEELTVRLYSITGQVVSEYFGKLSTETVIPFSSERINKGLYIVEISGDNILSRKKLLLM